MHREAFVAEHCPHAPHTSHAGVVPLQSASPLHAEHEPLLQTGLLPPQSAPVKHWVHVFDDRSQRGTAGGQLASATHDTQVPRLALPASVSQ